jgi:hypothetical protein
VLAGCGVIVCALGLITTSRWGLATAARTAALFTPAGQQEQDPPPSARAA